MYVVTVSIILTLLQFSGELVLMSQLTLNYSHSCCSIADKRNEMKVKASELKTSSQLKILQSL